MLRLDCGGGKDLSLDECSRETLEKEVFLVFNLRLTDHANIIALK